MLQTLRNNMKLVLWITVIFFVLLIFLVWGADLQFGGRGSGPAQPNAVGMVNGQPIFASTYQQILALNRQNLQAQGRELEPTEELRIEEETWNALVNEMLLNQEAKKRGLTARDAEVRAVLLNTPPPAITQDPNFRDAQGQFDLSRFQALLRDPATPETFLLQLEAYVRDYLPTQKLQTLVMTSAKVTDEEVRRAYQEQNEKARITYVLLDIARMPVDEAKIEADLESYFGEHAESYRMPRRVDLTYLMVPRRATAEDSLRLRQDLAEMAAEARQAEAAKAAGAENLSVSDFATLATSFSATPNAEQGGLSPGFIKPSEMSPALARAIVGLSPGQITEPYQEGLFFHIAQVAEMKDENGERSYRIRDLGLRIAPSDSTLMAEQERLEKLRQRANSVGLKKAAEEANLTTRDQNDVVATGIAPGLAAIPDVGAWAHRQETGTVSRVLSATNGWYLVEVGAFEPEGIPALETVKDRVRIDLFRERRLEGGRARAEALAARARGGMTLEAAAALDTLQAVSFPEVTRATGVPGLGREVDVLAAVFHQIPGAVSDPLRTQRGWVILRVDERPPLDWTAFEGMKAQLRQTELAGKESQLLQRFLEDLRRNAKIVDYRS